MRKRIIIGALGIGMVGVMAIGGAAYASYDKAVVLSIDGKDREVHTFGNTVSDVLAGEKIQLRGRDLVAPTPTTEVSDGSRIAVRYARPLTLTVDGEEERHWVTALSVGQAFADLGVRYAGAELSASRSMGIGRSGVELEVSTLKRVVIEHKGERTPIETTAVTVGEAVDEAKLNVDVDDRISPDLSHAIEDGDVIHLKRVDVKLVKRTVDIDHETTREPDSSMYTDESETVTAGQDGRKVQLLQVTYVDGEKKVSEVLSAQVTREPVTEVVRYGTEERPYGDVGGDVDSLNWAALAECESGGDPRAVNPAGYYGLYQFALSTWESVGGSGNPIDASPEEQTYRAKLLYEAAGAGQWACGSHLYD